jgi:hypothetical protein
MSDPIEDLEQLDAELEDKKQGKETKATKLVKLALGEDVEVFHTPPGDAYVTIPIDGRRETWALRTRTVRRWLARLYYEAYEDGVGEQSVKDALGVLGGRAMFDGDEHDVHVRVAGHEGRIYLDLADADWQAVEITADGWRVVANPPVRSFARAGCWRCPFRWPADRLKSCARS